MTKVRNIVELRTDPKRSHKEINAANRRRAKQMETDLSKILIGSTRGKVAASGAGQQKGDIWTPLPNESGMLYGECKTSEFVHDTLGKGVPLQYSFFEKVLKDTRSMQGRLGILVVKWYDKSLMVALFNEQDVPTVQAIGGKDNLVFSGPIIGKLHTNSGRELKNNTLYLNQVLNSFKTSAATGEIPHIRYATPSGTWIGVDVYVLKELLGYL